MIKKYNFENSANKKLMAEILTRRERQPRATFLSSLAAIMVAAISLSMVFGSLSTSAVPLEEQKQAQVSFVSDGEVLPPETVTRVHTETRTETVDVYNYSTTFSETLLLSAADNTDYPDDGKAIFDQEKQLFQWQYNGETFTFFVKDNTVYRRSETTGKTVAMFKGEEEVTLFCLNDRYLFFGAITTISNGCIYCENIGYCYRADLITGEMLRLFSYYLNQDTGDEVFVRFDGSDIIFTHFIVHEDGSYERIPDDQEHDSDNDENEYFDNLILQLNDDNTIIGEDEYGNYYDLGININILENLGYEFNDFSGDKSLICRDDTGYEYIYTSFETVQNDSYDSFLLYYGKMTDAGIDGVLIHASAPNSRGLSIYDELLSPKELRLFYLCYDTDGQFTNEDWSIPVNFDNLTAETNSKTEFYPLKNGENLTITYYPCKPLHTSTPDSV